MFDKKSLTKKAKLFLSQAFETKNGNIDKKCETFFVSKAIDLTKNALHFLFQTLDKNFVFVKFLKGHELFLSNIFCQCFHFLSGFCQGQVFF